MRLALKFAYHGKGFYGFSKQPGLRTVEAAILRALAKAHIDYANFQYASRTDRGVSALGNVLAFDTAFKPNNILPALNANADTVWFYAFEEVNELFNPRYAEERWYRYLVFDAEDLDIAGLRASATRFTGTHDFTNFARVDGRNPLRTLHTISITRANAYENLLYVDIKGESFLHNMVRRIVAALLQVARDETSAEELERALNSPDTRYDFGKAPAANLMLVDVRYEFAFRKSLPQSVIELIRADVEPRTNQLELEREFYKSLLDIIL